MDGDVVALVVMFAVHGGFMWYKIGKLEQKLLDLCREVRNNNREKGGKKDAIT